jgi:hypothetical protein
LPRITRIYTDFVNYENYGIMFKLFVLLLFQNFRFQNFNVIRSFASCFFAPVSRHCGENRNPLKKRSEVSRFRAFALLNCQNFDFNVIFYD